MAMISPHPCLRGAVAGSSNLKVAPPSSSMGRPMSPGVSLRGALVGNSNFNKVAPTSSNAGLGVLGAMLLVGLLWTGRKISRVPLAARGRKTACGDGGNGSAKPWSVFSTLKSYAAKWVKMRGDAKSLKTRLEETEMKAALNDAANVEMQLALEEELAHHKAAQRMLEHHFVGAQNGYNEMSFLLEATSAAQEKAEKEVQNLKPQMTRLSKACSTLLERIKELTSKVRGCQEENKALKAENQALHEELEEQKVLIKELFKLQEGGAQRCQKLLAENHVLQRRLENSQRQVAVLLDDR